PWPPATKVRPPTLLIIPPLTSPISRPTSPYLESSRCAVQFLVNAIPQCCSSLPGHGHGGLFQDNNKNTRTVHLQYQFGNTHLEDFPNVGAYCQALKSTADQLASLGHLMTDERLVLQLVAALHDNDDYRKVAIILSFNNSCPSHR
ncbi:Tetratricopeptide repeat protein 30B, partial [Bienertia sinuspersici]